MSVDGRDVVLRLCMNLSFIFLTDIAYSCFDCLQQMLIACHGADAMALSHQNLRKILSFDATNRIGLLLE
jgi:hypothetical protein